MKALKKKVEGPFQGCRGTVHRAPTIYITGLFKVSAFSVCSVVNRGGSRTTPTF